VPSFATEYDAVDVKRQLDGFEQELHKLTRKQPS
jgi:hypothetical protein